MPRTLPTLSNPKNRFASTSVEYDDGEAPIAGLEIIEDHSKSILATNDSPDVGFRWSVNPYRGCLHACSYCCGGDTLILMGDGSTRRLGDLRVGDSIYGTEHVGACRRYVKTQVLDHWSTRRRAYRITLVDGTELIASGDHRFLTNRGWKYVVDAEQASRQRPHLTTKNIMLGVGKLHATPTPSSNYKRGYLDGRIRGDTCFEGPTTPALAHDDLARTRAYLEELGVGRRSHDWPGAIEGEWARGFLASLFDAEGSFDDVVRIVTSKTDALRWTEIALRHFAFDVSVEAGHDGRANVRLRGGLSEQLRFFHLVDPAIRREIRLEGKAVRSSKKRERLRVVSIEDLREERDLFDITTGTGDFIADGVVSHNCYARPSHEYLSLGAGSDFERKIVVKPRAPELLREAFEKKAWRGELVVFSGVTDCYQPIEREMKITRACLEVCAEYRNPVGLITKSPVIERDLDVLQELHRVASVRVSVSVPFWDPDVARAMEPMVTTPERRLKILETLSRAGIPTGLSVSPIVPGLNDDHLGDVLERAAQAGATHAFYVLLRLPGAVREVFEAALRDKLPLRAEKVLRRLREAHRGKLYDSTFGARGRGEGVYAETIRLLFERTARRLGLSSDEILQYASPATFRRPEKKGQTSFGF